MHGVLVIDKPAGLTSAGAVEKVRRTLHLDRAGHGGTLDPIATGVLPVCVGAGTKLAQFLLADDKAYEAEAVLGVETDTLDRTGRVVAEHSVAVTRDALLAVLAAHLGEQAGRSAALRSRARRRGGRARAAPDPDRSPRPPRVRAAAVPDRRRVQQGDVHPQPGRRHRSGAARGGAPRGAPAHALGPVHDRAGGRARPAGRGR